MRKSIVVFKGHKFISRTIVITAMSGVAATLLMGETTHSAVHFNPNSLMQDYIRASHIESQWVHQYTAHCKTDPPFLCELRRNPEPLECTDHRWLSLMKAQHRASSSDTSSVSHSCALKLVSGCCPVGRQWLLLPICQGSLGWWVGNRQPKLLSVFTHYWPKCKTTCWNAG